MSIDKNGEYYINIEDFIDNSTACDLLDYLQNMRRRLENERDKLMTEAIRRGNKTDYSWPEDSPEIQFILLQVDGLDIALREIRHLLNY